MSTPKPPKPRMTFHTFAVLQILAAAPPGQPVYGGMLQEQTGLPSATVHPILARLDRAGWVQSHWEQAGASSLGRPRRRYYTLTAAGVEGFAQAKRDHPVFGSTLMPPPDWDPQCSLCLLLRQGAGVRWVVREPAAAAFAAPEPLAAGHVLVVPAAHYASLFDVPPAVLNRVMGLVQRLAAAMGPVLDASGVNVVHASGEDAGQKAPHLYFHVVPRWRCDGLPISSMGAVPAADADDYESPTHAAVVAQLAAAMTPLTGN